MTIYPSGDWQSPILPILRLDDIQTMLSKRALYILIIIILTDQGPDVEFNPVIKQDGVQDRRRHWPTIEPTLD